MDRRLGLAVDGRELGGRPTGVGRYLWHLLDEWSKTPTGELDITVIVPAAPDPVLRSAWPTIRWQVEPGGRGTLWEQVRLPGAVRRSRADVFFAPAYTMPLGVRCPTVVTIHDLSYFAHPEWFGAREGRRRRLLTRATVRRAAAILTVSRFSAGELERRLHVPANKIHVTPHGAPRFDGQADAPREPVVLYVGSLFERRHIGELLAAFALVAQRVPDARLVIVGEDRGRTPIDPAAMARAAGVAERVEWRPYVPEPDLVDLYARARVFAFLSDYEGFALTPLEAIAHGVPPVLLDTSVSREVYRDAAHFVSASPDSIAHSLVALLTSSSEREALAAAGRRLLDLYQWPETARATLDVMRSVVPRT